MPEKSDNQEIPKMPEEAVNGYCVESVSAFQQEILNEHPWFTKVPIKPQYSYDVLSAVGLPMCIWDGARVKD